MQIVAVCIPTAVMYVHTLYYLQQCPYMQDQQAKTATSFRSQGIGIGIGSNDRQGFGHPVVFWLFGSEETRLMILQGHPFATSDPQQTSCPPPDQAIWPHHFWGCQGRCGERVCFNVAARSLATYFPIRAFPPGSSPAPMALPYHY
jgi:hypothetical protein